MSKNILQELPELVQAKVITEETAQNITAYYDRKPSASSNRLFIVFGILGALLVGMGIILIIAHNFQFDIKTSDRIMDLSVIAIHQMKEQII